MALTISVGVQLQIIHVLIDPESADSRRSLVCS